MYYSCSVISSYFHWYFRAAFTIDNQAEKFWSVVNRKSFVFEENAQ